MVLDRPHAEETSHWHAEAGLESKWNPHRRENVGPPVEIFRKSAEEEVTMANITWNTAEKSPLAEHC